MDGVGSEELSKPTTSDDVDAGLRTELTTILGWNREELGSGAVLAIPLAHRTRLIGNWVFEVTACSMKNLASTRW